MASFLASSWRRLLFPYLEGADDEDPTTNTHWMSNITNQALGLERERSCTSTTTHRLRNEPVGPFSSSSSSSSPSLVASSSSCSSSSRDAPTSPLSASSLVSDSKDVPWASMYLRQSLDQSDDGSSTDGNDGASPSLMSHLRRYEQPTAHCAPQRSGSGPRIGSGSSSRSHSRSRRRSHADMDGSAAVVAAAAATPRQEPRTASQQQQQQQQQQVAASWPLPPPALPINFRSAASAPLRSRHDAQNTSTSSMDSVVSTSSTRKRTRVHGHRRQRSATHPQPLTPAQPLDHVDTFLPVRVPPLELQAKSPLDYPSGFFARDAKDTSAAPIKEPLRTTARRTRRNNARSTSAMASDGDVPSATATVVHCSESDGSHHGDPGDEDPESQLAAGIARLKAKGREQHAKARQSTASSAGPSNSRVVNEGSPSREHRRASIVDAVTKDDDDEKTSREIAQHSGIFTSLADIVLEFKIMRSGPFRLRATSHAAVTDLAHQTEPQQEEGHGAGGGPLARCHSVDTISHSPAMRTSRAFHNAKSPPLLGSADISTPDSLRDEVRQWSRERRKSKAKQLQPQRLLSPPPQVEDFPFASSLIGRSSSFRDFASIAEALPVEDGADDSEDAEEHSLSSGLASPQHIALLSSHAASRSRRRDAGRGFARADGSSSSADDTDADTDTDTETGTDQGDSSGTTEDAFSSLWATPAGSSRSSSHYNLELLSSDERSAFDDETQASFLNASLRGKSPFAWSSGGAARTRPPGMTKMSPITAMVPQTAATMTERRRSSTSKGTGSAVSPLWDVTHGCQDEAEAALKDGRYQRSWSSLLGMTA